MIIKIHKAGRSFQGVCRYLTHDPKAETAGRVVWTHTLNLACDDVPSAVNEMLWTYRSADLLKREAGISTGGSKLQKPIRHFSLSWPQGEAPTKEHMIGTVRRYLEHMGLADRQAVLVAHDDTRHAHAHVVINSVSPVDGRAARNSHDWRRSEAFALQYEREHGRIHCEQRLKPREERESTPTREQWQRFKQSEIAFDRAEVERLTKMPDYFERHDSKSMNGREWEALKAYQRREREQFFVQGKAAFRVVRTEAFRGTRNEFRGQWNAYYAAARHGHDRASLAETKAALLKAQNRALDARRTAACDGLRETRDRAYEAILAQQQFDRSELGRRQKQGLRTYALMDVIYPAPEPERPAQKTTMREVGAPENLALHAMFDRAGQSVIHPLGRSEPARQPGVLRRGSEPSTPAQDGFGRALSDADKALGTRRLESPGNAEPPRNPRAEMTDAASERVQVQKTREITDQRASKEQSEEAALRASWNRHRRHRGERD